MKSSPDCLHCFIKQGISCMRFAHIPEEAIVQHIYTLMDDIKKYDMNDSPAYNSSLVMLKAYDLIDHADPYKEEKKKSNQEALSFYPDLERLVEKSQDRLYTAIQIAVAGNVIDLGIHSDYDIEKEVESSLSGGFARNDYALLTERLALAKQVLILADNSGEIVFDKLLVKELIRLGKKVIYMVKGSPINNDTTLEDAQFVGMDQLTQVETSGCNFMGFCAQKVSSQAMELFNSSSLVIAKGQANFESLNDNPSAHNKVFSILKAKCDLVAKEAEVALGDLILMAL